MNNLYLIYIFSNMIENIGNSETDMIVNYIVNESK